MCQMFKGFDKAKDIQYVYTPVFSSLCGVKLDSNNKAGYLDGRLSIGQCDLVESWDNLSLSQRKNLNYRYQMGCECRINVCYTVPCASTGENECLWTDWLLDNSLNGEQARQYACWIIFTRVGRLLQSLKSLQLVQKAAAQVKFAINWLNCINS
uniref:Metalloproteinase inhibitor 4 n=1 Tax=Hippocampus comes TaxID=109280 RepID=A0A3Q2YE67_HIPCM